MATATLNANIDFPVGASGEDATHWTLWDAQSGGKLLWTDTVVGNPAPLGSNQFFRVLGNSLVITQPPGADGCTAEMARRGAAGMVVGITYLQVHSGAPGSAGTANVLGSARAAVANANWTVAA